MNRLVSKCTRSTDTLSHHSHSFYPTSYSLYTSESPDTPGYTPHTLSPERDNFSDGVSPSYTPTSAPRTAGHNLSFPVTPSYPPHTLSPPKHNSSNGVIHSYTPIEAPSTECPDFMYPVTPSYPDMSPGGTVRPFSPAQTYSLCYTPGTPPFLNSTQTQKMPTYGTSAQVSEKNEESSTKSSAFGDCDNWSELKDFWVCWRKKVALERSGKNLKRNYRKMRKLDLD